MFGYFFENMKLNIKLCFIIFKVGYVLQFVHYLIRNTCQSMNLVTLNLFVLIAHAHLH